MSRYKWRTRMVSVAGTLHYRFAGLGQQTGAATSRAPQDHGLVGNGTREIAYVNVVAHRLPVQSATQKC